MSLPLAGRRILITRPAEQSAELCRRLAELGALPVLFPVIAIAPPEPGGPLDAAIEQLQSYDWVLFTSVNGVRHFFDRLAVVRAGQEPPMGLGAAPQVAAIGPATAAALVKRAVTITLLPAEYCATALLRELAARGAVDGRRFLLPRADIAPPDLADGLRAAGAQVDEVSAYRTHIAGPAAEALAELRRGVDVITFTSSSTVEHFATLARGIDYGAPLIACIGPVTAQTARCAGLEVDLVAEDYTVAGLVAALLAHLGSRERPVEG